uniref:Uncharacterized protein n=1 Tax=Anguilla anguilla TaxID=7936 RepID=A0A0E9T0P5_ANGAN
MLNNFMVFVTATTLLQQKQSGLVSPQVNNEIHPCLFEKHGLPAGSFHCI